MSVAQRTEGNIFPLCYEHHTKMVPKELVGAGHATYVCQEPGCPVYYDPTVGYFLNKEAQEPTEYYAVPKVHCPSDSRPMYLAEVQAEHPNFRRWQCPKCDASRTSG